MALNRDIYHSEEQLEKGLATLYISNGYRKEDVADIKNFVGDMAAQGVRPIRLKKQTYVLRKVSELVSKPYRKAGKKDIMELVRKIDSVKNHAEWTKYDRKVVLKRFYRWLNGDEEYPSCIKWLKLKDPKNSILPEELITEEEVIKAIDAAKYMRDKAFIYALYESGCRISELLTLQIKNVSFGDHVTSLLVSGKTGQRRVPLVSSTTYLSVWLSMHPLKDNPDAPLWTKIVDKWHPQSSDVLSYKGAQKMLMVTFKRAGIRKRPSPHLFRHSRATILANTAWKLLLRQEPAVIRELADKFNLNQEEQNFLLTADIGEGLLFAMNEHIPLKIIASEKEYEMITTNPDEIREREKKLKELEKKEEDCAAYKLEKKIYLRNDLNPTQIKFLLNEGFAETRQVGLENGSSQWYLVKTPNSGESLKHRFLVELVAEEIRKCTDAVDVMFSQKPDILFVAPNKTNYIRGERVMIAVEVETGSVIKNKRKIEEKVKGLNENYKIWFFVVANKRMKREYEKYGETLTRANVREKIDELFEGKKKPMVADFV